MQVKLLLISVNHRLTNKILVVRLGADFHTPAKIKSNESSAKTFSGRAMMHCQSVALGNPLFSACISSYRRCKMFSFQSVHCSNKCDICRL